MLGAPLVYLMTRPFVLLVAIAVALPTAIRPIPIDAAEACTRNPFDEALVETVERRWPGRGITAEVEDLTDGCRYRLHPERLQTTASVIKVTIMAAVLLRAQDEDRAVSEQERAQIVPMIRTSDNPTASSLWVSLGGSEGVQAVVDRFGLADTAAVSPRWGASLTSASDQVDLLRQVLLGGGPLDEAGRADARAFLLDVAPEQRWGVTAGVPPTWEVPLKNGFYPSRGWGWRINSVGLVEGPTGPRWVVAILTDGWATEAAGIEAAEFVASHVSRSMLRFRPPTHAPGVGSVRVS